MDYPTQEQLLGATEDPSAWIDRHFLRQDPFAFSSASRSFHELACSIADWLDVERNGVFCIGSGAVGWSVNPQKIASGKLKQFDPSSDVDLAVISLRHFEVAWRDLLKATQPHLSELPEELEQNLLWQKKRLFDGAILTNKLLGFLSFGTTWIAAIDKVSERISVSLDRNVTVGVWVYRDYWSLRNYVARGVVACQRTLPMPKEP